MRVTLRQGIADGPGRRCRPRQGRANQRRPAHVPL